MKTKSINPGWYSFLVILMCIFLGALMSSCDCRSDDGVQTVSMTLPIIIVILSVFSIVVIFIIALVFDIDTSTNSFFPVFLFTWLLFSIMALIWNIDTISALSAVDHPEFEKQYLYQQINDTLYVITDSIYIKLY